MASIDDAKVPCSRAPGWLEAAHPAGGAQRISAESLMRRREKTAGRLRVKKEPHCRVPEL